MKKENQIYDTDYIHNLSIHNWEHKNKSKTCGCFYCLKVYDASLLTKEDQPSEWEDTWLCKYCWIDSLIFDSAYKFDEKLLKKMRKQWFSWCFPEDMTLFERMSFEFKLYLSRFKK